MIPTVQVTGVLLVSIAMALALAHALELPGKLRLDKQTYVAVQTIYYPGFTYGGLGEGFGMVVLLALLFLMPGGDAWWWTFAALVLLVTMHLVYWLVTHPVNKFWLKDQALKGFGRGFFSLGSASPALAGDGPDVWERARDRWEYSHVVRAVLGVAALAALAVAVAL